MNEPPRFEGTNRKSDRRSVNETKPALFSTPDNVHFADDAGIEIFAMIATRSIISRTS
ncbi:hypothetical protein [Bradyrhizobium uaiense]|uniref:hypothetical protein n=1 Tax=Bradyrhizobium uaiense TaxID=2594946 RepID=UPI0013D32B21|nr:hypothetical protein [Bradyrhizobium uaiense]